jgi:signal transduction histidine kinase
MLDIMYTNKSIETFVRLYVGHFTENAAKQLDKGGLYTLRDDPSATGQFQQFGKLAHSDLLGYYPTYFAIFSKNGDFIYGSEKLRIAASVLDAGRLSNGADEIAFESVFEGERFTISKYPALDGAYWAVGAISWRDVPDTADISIFLWLLIILMTLWCASTIMRLMNKILRPIIRLEKAVSSLKWGYDTLDLGTFNTATPAIRHIYDSLVKVSNDVVNTVQENRLYMSDLVNVQEDERMKISRDIHDGPLQDVTALIQRMRLARLPDSTEEDRQRELDLAEKIAFAAVKEMRALCNFLNPPWLELGLSQALTELTERQSVQYGVKIFLGVEDDLDLSESVTLAFFRVVQEAVTNSVKHGEAGNIWIDIAKTDDGISLTVQDDGHGFDMKTWDKANLRAEGHRGLSNMEERISLVGGSLKIISYKGEGTCIRALLP